jgi:Rhs element Vgr protein
MSTVTATISKKGKKLDPKYQVIMLDVSREINRIPSARIVLIDGDPAQQKFEVTDSDFFEPGSEIEIKLRDEDETAKEAVVFKGLAMSQTISADKEGYLLTVDLKHKAISLTTGRKSTVFVDKTDDDIVPLLLKASGVSVSGSLKASYPHKQLVQYCSSDWDFAMARIDANGCALVLKDEQIIIQSVKDMEAGSPGGRKINVGIDEVFDYEFAVDASGQLEGVKTTAWDIKKQSLTALKSSPPFDASFGNLKGKSLAGKIKAAERLMVNSAEVDEKEIIAWGDAQLIKSRMSLFRGRIKVRGRADLFPGTTIDIEGLGQRFKGKALISGVSHVADQHGWTTSIELGLSPAWFIESAHQVSQQPAQGLLPAIHGLQIGVVEEFKEDPAGNFRVKVKLPAFQSDKDGIVYARLASLYAGQNYGALFFPEKGDEVVMGFLNDDPRHAVIVGSLYSSARAIPEGCAVDVKNLDKGIVMKNGAQLKFKDDKDKSIIELKTKGKNAITFDDGKKSVVITDQAGNKIEMTDSGITIKSAKDITLEASGNVTIKGSKVDIK